MAATIIQQKRFTNEKVLLAKEPLHYTTAYPDKTNPLVWYCLIIGQKGTPYHEGHYVYKVVHSPKYPAEPPDYYFLTPSGRYEVEKKICLTNSSYHKGEWSSTWNIKTILISFYSIFLDNKEGGISHIHESPAKCMELAKTSIEYNKKHWNEIYSGFDFTYLSDDAPNIKLIKPKTSDDTDTKIPVQELKAEIKVIEPVIEEIKPKIEVVKKEDLPIEIKKVKKAKTGKVKVVDTEKSESIHSINEKLQKQFNDIKELEEDIKLFK